MRRVAGGRDAIKGRLLLPEVIVLIKHGFAGNCSLIGQQIVWRNFWELFDQYAMQRVKRGKRNVNFNNFRFV
jgi:hypothetical protein